MESVAIKLNAIDEFDKVCHHKDALPDAGGFSMITKDDGTQQGRPCVLLTHRVQLPDGSIKIAQTTITGRLFAQMAAAFRGRYGNNGDAVVAHMN